MLYTRQNLIGIIKGHRQTEDQYVGVNQETLDRVMNRMAERLNSMTELEIIDLIERQNGIKLRNFAPGLYFISGECQEYSCQII